MTSRTIREIPGTAGPPSAGRETGRRPPVRPAALTRRRSLYTPTRRWRAVAVATMLTLVVTLTPATGALAALPQPTDPMLTGAIPLLGANGESEPTPTADPTSIRSSHGDPRSRPRPPTAVPTATPAADPTPPTPLAPPPTPARARARRPRRPPGPPRAAAVVTPAQPPRPRVVAASRRPARPCGPSCAAA